MKKRKKKWLRLGILCGAVSILVLGFKIKDYIETPLWYEFKGELMKENRLIKSINRDYFLCPRYTIWICFKNEQIDFDIVEPIFETFLKELNRPGFVDELYAYCEKKGGSIASIGVRFRLSENGNSPFFYKFYIELQQGDKESLNRGVWVLTDSTQKEYLSKKYRASDYK